MVINIVMFTFVLIAAKHIRNLWWDGSQRGNAAEQWVYAVQSVPGPLQILTAVSKMSEA